MPVYKQLGQNKLLLDTHVVVWLSSDDPKLKKSFKEHIDQIVERDEVVFISAISVWEIGMLAEHKKVKLEMDPLEWIERLLEKEFTLLPITSSIAINSSRLPENPHGDPADRLLIATANEHHAILVTHDRKILDYGKGKFIGVYDPCS